MAFVADPQGAAFGVWQPNQHLGSRVDNEHGAVNFNDLHTDDIEGAKAFYGAVFGWGPLDMGGGNSTWTLQAYGDHLEELNPGQRERIGEMGAPDDFIDVVASLGPVQGGAPPSWGVTFGVDDADAIAAKARELGGEVLAGPFDANGADGKGGIYTPTRPPRRRSSAARWSWRRSTRRGCRTA